MISYRNKINNVIAEILVETDDVTYNELLGVWSKLEEEGFTQETIYDEFVELKRKIIRSK